MRTIVFYISGHGFGHASRSIEVINAVLALAPDVRVIARTSAPRWLFERTIAPAETGTRLHSEAPGLNPGSRFTLSDVETDTGAVQIDSLHVDESATIASARAFMRDFEARVDRDAAFLREVKAQVVVSDIPALGIAAARRAGLRAIGFGNFTWDWIYSAYSGSDDVVRAVGEAYSCADGALRLPMHGGFTTFPNIVDVPLVARRSRRHPDETRHALAWPEGKRLVLLSFGGYGIERIDQSSLASLGGYAVIGSTQYPLDESAMYAAGFRYEDVVRAADVVVSKPGYGIISECIANDTALLYTSRGHFVEYDVLVRDMPRYLRARYIDHADLFAGRWQASLDAVLGDSAPADRPRVDGAEVTARQLLGMM